MKISLKSLKVCHNHWLFKSLLYFKKSAHCWKATSVLSILDHLCCSKAVSYPLICYPLVVKIIHCPLSTASISCFHQKYCPSFSPVVVTWAVHSSQTFCNGCHVSVHSLSYNIPNHHQNRVLLSNWILKKFSSQSSFSSHFSQISSIVSFQKWQNRSFLQNPHQTHRKQPLKRQLPLKFHSKNLTISWVFSQNQEPQMFSIPLSPSWQNQSTKLCSQPTYPSTWQPKGSFGRMQPLKNKETLSLQSNLP